MPEPESQSSSRPAVDRGAGHSPDPANEPRAEPVGAEPPTVRTRGTSGSSTPSPRRVASEPLPEPGERIDTFELREAIGAGGMGAVFKAFDTRLHRLVALKILPPEQAHDAEILQRFYQEGQSAAQLDHENIARVYTIGSDQKLHFIAFEYIEGTTIRQRVEKNGPLPLDEAINYTLQIAGALVHAAERDVVHRDIKPSNIIVTPQGRAKLVDMGLARRFERGGDHGLTQSGMTLGTFDYISPEQARDPRDVDVRSDLYSLGCTLFHMLTGRPPFPEGTVLQKLLQHQEDPPPDVRALNPHVPQDLAAILVKLMAKDRDRRYQTPEQLVRDLLTVAGTLGLRSISPEGLVWMAATARPAWERHLVWGLPAAALILVVCVLVWFQEWATPSAPYSPEPPAAIAISPPQTPAATEKKDVSSPAIARTDAESVEAATLETEGSAAAPGQFAVETGEDLVRILATAPAGSTVLLTDNGPYDLRLVATDQTAPLLLGRRDLTLKAAPGVRPVLRLTRVFGQGQLKGGSALCRIKGGHVVFEGLEFLVDPGERDEPIDAVLAEDADVSLRNCLFHRPGARNTGGRVSALHVRTTTKSSLLSDRAAPVVVDACHFDGGQVGVVGDGPVDISLRDCTFGGSDPVVWLDSAEDNAFPASLHLNHVSIVAGNGPVFRFSGREERVRLDDSVVAPPREGEVTLVGAHDPNGLDWVGRGNLYAKVSTYVQPARDRLGRAPIRRFEVWADSTSSAPREIESIASNAFVWLESDPLQVLAQDDPTRAFLLGTSQRPSLNVGARRGPFGSLAPGAELLAAASGPARFDERPDAVTEPKRSDEKPPSRTATPPTATGEPGPMPMPMPKSTGPMIRLDDGSELPAMPPMGRPEPEAEPAERTRAGGSGAPGSKEQGARDVPEAERAAASTSGAAKPDADSSLIRTSQQFLDALGHLGSRGGILRLAADADLDLPSREIRGSGRWVIQAESGNSRPRIRFQPASAPADSRRNTASPVLFRLRSGALQVQGIDIVLTRDRAPASGRWAAFGVWAGTDLSLNQCTITVEGDPARVGDPPRSAVVVVQGSETEIEAGVGGNDPSAASVRVTDSLLRSGGDFIDVTAGRKLDLEITNAVVATVGSLVHGHGLPRGQTAEPVRFGLRQVTARDAGGLVQLESAPGEPELPVADVVARDSIFATTPQGEPLFRVDGQDSIDSLRDKVRWEGHGVAYHQIGTYRRDQTRQIGTLPVSYDRHLWGVAVAPRDDSPVYDDTLKFATEWDANRPLWTLIPDDVRLAPDSPVRTAGPDLDRIPSPGAATQGPG